MNIRQTITNITESAKSGLRKMGRRMEETFTLSDLPFYTREKFSYLASKFEEESKRRSTEMIATGGHEHVWKDGGFIAQDQRIRTCSIPGCGVFERIDANGNPQA